MNLSYTRSGNPNADAIVFLHGMAMGQWMWHEQTEHFADYDCYNVDLPGHGSSHRIAWESFDHAAECVAHLITENIHDKAVHLVGMSLGAVVGLHLVAHHPQLVKRAVLTGAFAEAPPRLMIKLQGGIMSFLLTTQFGKRMFARLLQIPSDAMPAFQESIDSLSVQTYRRIVQQIADYTPLARLDAVTTPLLFVTGEKDVAFNRRSIMLLSQQVPEATGVYAPEVHHGWNGEDPALFNEMTRQWIEGRSLPQRLIPAA